MYSYIAGHMLHDSSMNHQLSNVQNVQIIDILYTNAATWNL